MPALQRAVCLIVGALLVLGAVFDDEPRWAILAVGLVLMGVLSTDQLLELVHRRPPAPPGEPPAPGD